VTARPLVDGFPEPVTVEGRASVADLFPASRRCGLYVLYFADGDIYAGKAADVTRRYVQHRQAHADIQQMSFRCVARSKVDEEERALIWRLEADGHRLRNIIFTSLPKGVADLDLVVSLDEQARWLDDHSHSDISGPRAVDPDLRRKYARRYARFAALDRSQEAIAVLQRYVQCAIPAPLRTELSFWAVSCLPAGNAKEPGELVLARINLPWQVTLTVSEFGGDIDGSFFLAVSPLEQAYGKSLKWLEEHFPTIAETDNLLEPGGHDQINLIVSGAVEVRRFLEQPPVVAAMRLFNLRLMKKGGCSMYSRYHCLDLADRLLEPPAPGSRNL
jgi:hypothetical protein